MATDRPTPTHLLTVPPPTEEVQLSTLQEVLLALDKFTKILTEVNANLVLVDAGYKAHTAAVRALEARAESLELTVASYGRIQTAQNKLLDNLSEGMKRVLSK